MCRLCGDKNPRNGIEIGREECLKWAAVCLENAKFFGIVGMLELEKQWLGASFSWKRLADQAAP